MPLVKTQSEMMNSPADAENPSPAMPTRFATSDAWVIRRSMCGVVIRGSRNILRMVGRKKRTSAETRAFRARAPLTFARLQCRTREVYWGKRT